MQFPANNQRGKCAFCRKEIPIKDVRDKSPQFCDRVCKSMGRYGTRYEGGGKTDVPDLMKKTQIL